MTIEMNITKLPNHLAVFSISGRITAATAPLIKDQIKTLLSDGFIQLIMDLDNTGFIDSSGLSAFVSGLKQVKELNGSLKLAGLKPEVLSIFKLTMLDRVFELYPTKEEAIGSIKE